jgi:hypothetical protein
VLHFHPDPFLAVEPFKILLQPARIGRPHFPGMQRRAVIMAVMIAGMPGDASAKK